jgi:putative hydrolase
MMSIIEGYSNHVMNAIGRDLLRNYDSISKKFEVRQRNRSQAEQLFARISGLDLKMEQYRQGQKFIDTIVAQRGHDTAKLVWTGPEYLPTIAEIRDPAAWLVRIDTLEH